MDKDFREQLEHYKDNISLQFQLAGITEKTAPAYITKEMAIAIAANDWDTWQTLVGMACAIENQDTRATALNQLLLMPGHEFHQEVAFAIQCGAHPSSVSAIHKVLEQGFAMFTYTGSDDGVIAKWFSHALACIGTPEALAVIQQFSQSNNEEIAAEMNYRLGKIQAVPD